MTTVVMVDSRLGERFFGCDGLCFFVGFGWAGFVVIVVSLWIF
jgi:hypothetical protein